MAHALGDLLRDGGAAGRQREEAPDLAERPGRLGRELAFGDVDHHAMQPPDPLVLVADQMDEAPEPNDAAVRRDHPILDHVVLDGRGRPHRMESLPVLGVQVVEPEVGLRVPALERVAEDALGRLADEQDLPGRSVRLPHDRGQPVHETVEPPSGVERRGQRLRAAALRLGVRDHQSWLAVRRHDVDALDVDLLEARRLYGAAERGNAGDPE